MLTLYKAVPVGDRTAADLRLEATEEMPAMPHHREFPDMQVWEEACRERYDAQARIVVDALVASLPGGTIDAILCELMERRRSILRVPFTAPAKT
jgi:hypothetical protein